MSTPASNLLDFHLEQLRRSSINDDVIAGRGYQTVSRPTPGDSSPRNMLRRLGIPAWARDEDARFPGILMPMYRPTGEQISWQYRPDRAPKDPKTGRFRKYASQAGRASVIDVHPVNKDRIIDPTVPLLITEGVKKADSLVSRGYCVAALSGVWNWRSQLAALGDWEDIPLRGREVHVIYDSDVRTNKNVGAAMRRLGSFLKAKGAAKVVYVITPPSVNGTETKGVDDFFYAGGMVQQLWAASSTEPPVQAEAPAVDAEGYLVEVLAEEALEGSWLWSAGVGWLRYDPPNGRWKPTGNDKDAAINDAVREWLIAKHTDAAASYHDAVRRGRPSDEIKRLEVIAGTWRTTNNRTKIGNLAALARGVPTIQRDMSEFDAHPELLNTPGGVANLITGELGPHDPDLLFTKVTRARYVPGARHPDWDKALLTVPANVLGYLRLRYGQAVTGNPPPDDVVLVQLGKGSNGKTSLVYAVQGALGGYFQLISERAVIRDKSSHPTELMDFRGARIAVMEELAEDRHLNMRNIKIITGPEINARYCGKDSEPFDTTHALMLSTNHDPVVTETDHGSWRRLLAIRFPYKYHDPAAMPDEPGVRDRAAERGLRERMKDGGEGRAEAVLAWLVEGAVRFHAGEEGKRKGGEFGPVPGPVRRDTEAWRATSNPMFRWVTEALEPDARSHVSASELAEVHSSYLIAAGHTRPSVKTIEDRFTEACDALGWKVGKVMANPRRKSTVVSRAPGSDVITLTIQYRAWAGVRFKAIQDDSPDEAQAPDLGGFGSFGSSGGSIYEEDPDFRQESRNSRNQMPGKVMTPDWAAWWDEADLTAEPE